MDKPFLTIAQAAQYELVIKKSRFICSLQRIASEQEARDFIAEVQANNKKANHNCFAYLVGDHDQVQRESDNGEPSGTAGVPILESLQLAKLHNVVAVVTRYFGGVKLGAGGLIRAYSNVTTEAIHQAGIVQRVRQEELRVTVPYRLNDAFRYYLKEQQLTSAGEQYGVNVTINVYVNENRTAAATTAMQNRFNNQLTIEKAGIHFHEIPYQNKK